MKKYVFKPYSKTFPTLFEKEKNRIAPHLKKALEIEHVGSTAVPGLGGKGIIDIAIAVEQKNIDAISKELEALGYTFKANGSTPERLYFFADLPDAEEGVRRYHVHLTYPETTDWKQLIGFRDYLRSHPEEAEEYGDIKKKAVLEACEDGAQYRKLKQPLFKKVTSLIDKTNTNKEK